jgi:tRNA-dihydrouridine synthase A
MMEWTDRHCRVFLRHLTRRTRLYTEMIVAEAVVRGEAARLLAFSPTEHPVALQLGGSDPATLAEAARIGAGAGYDEINLNVGCPSGRVTAGRFGACLMAEPELVAACLGAMKAAVAVPVTVKCRLGIDDQDSETGLSRFVARQLATGADAVIVHARKAWLAGLSPKENRDVPPLDHDRVHRLKAAFPQVPIVINGGIADLAGARAHLGRVDGVMMGRAAYENPFLLARADRDVFGEGPLMPTRAEAAAAMVPYAEAELSRGTPLSAITRHMLGLYRGQPGARAWRRSLAEGARGPRAGPEVLLAALDEVEARARALAA